MERCPNCGALVRSEARFCTACGQRLDVASSESTGYTDSTQQQQSEHHAHDGSPDVISWKSQAHEQSTTTAVDQSAQDQEHQPVATWPSPSQGSDDYDGGHGQPANEMWPDTQQTTDAGASSADEPRWGESAPDQGTVAWHEPENFWDAQADEPAQASPSQNDVGATDTVAWPDSGDSWPQQDDRIAEDRVVAVESAEAVPVTGSHPTNDANADGSDSVSDDGDHISATTSARDSGDDPFENWETAIRDVRQTRDESDPNESADSLDAANDPPADIVVGAEGAMVVDEPESSDVEAREFVDHDEHVVVVSPDAAASDDIAVVWPAAVGAGDDDGVIDTDTGLAASIADVDVSDDDPVGRARRLIDELGALLPSLVATQVRSNTVALVADDLHALRSDLASSVNDGPDEEALTTLRQAATATQGNAHDLRALTAFADQAAVVAEMVSAFETQRTLLVRATDALRALEQDH